MDQTNELPYDAVAAHDQQPVVQTGTASQADINSLMAQATTMANQGGPGANQAVADTWLKSQLESFGNVTPEQPSGVLSYDAVRPISPTTGKTLDYDSVKPVGQKPDFSNVTGGPLEEPTGWQRAIGETIRYGGDYAKHATESIGNLFGSAGAYFKNFHEAHETFEPGEITPQERAAAKLMGMKTPGREDVVTNPNSPHYSPADVNSHGSIYKLTPEQRDQLSDKTMEAWGFTPQQERARVEASASGDWSNLDVVGGVTQKSLMANMAERILNPQIANTRKYYALQDTVKAMDAVANPSKYSPQFVQKSAELIAAYKKKLGQSDWDTVKEMWQQVKEEPGRAAKSLAYGMLQDPELLLVPEAKLGTLAAGAKIGRATEAGAQAGKLAQLAKSVEKAAATQPEIAAEAAKSADIYGRVAERAGLALTEAQKAARTGDVLGSIGAGAGLNTLIDAQEQMKKQGFVSEGSLTVPAMVGAGFGAVAHTLSALTPKGLHSDMQTRVDEARTREVGSSPEGVPDVNANKPAGEPLSPDTPINKNSNVPYYGGVDASGKIIHLDKNTPEKLSIKNLDGKMKDIPVMKTVAYHEQVEYPLMHMTGPISNETLQQIMNRIGSEGTIPKEVVQKLKDGKSLTYPEAHEIATLAENHLVRTLYRTDPKVYQDSLKPYIKDVGKASKDATSADIPVNLDSKPYDDMGHPENLKGAGGRPEVDQVEPGADKHADNKQRGQVDRRLLAAGGAAALGAAGGALAAPEGQREAGAVAGGLAGLAAAGVMSRGDINARGFGSRERGSFMGASSKTWNPSEERIATRMEKMGKTPEEINLATGMHRETGGKWVKELDDSKYQIKPLNDPIWKKAKEESVPLGDVINHTELKKAYPDILKDIKVKIVPDAKYAGAFNADTNTLYLNDIGYLSVIAQKKPARHPRSIIMHEVQHAIQKVEGLPKGSSTPYEASQLTNQLEFLQARQENLYQQWRDASLSGNDKLADQLDKKLDEVVQKIESFGGRAADRYNQQAGEVQARNVQTRLGMTPEERANLSPELTEDVPRQQQRIRYGQQGQIDPELLKKLGKAAALGTVGATIGATYLDPEHKFKGAWMGAGLALVGGEVKWNKLFPAFKDILKHDDRYNVNDLLNNWDQALNTAQRTTAQAQQKVFDFAPSKESQVKITRWLDGDKSIPLTNKEYEAAKIARQFYDSLGKAALDTGVLKDFLQDYVNHEWGDSAKAKVLQEQIASSFPTNMSPKDRHALARKFMTLEQGKKAGLVPKTENIVELMDIYSRSMARAMANKTLLDALKVQKLDPQGQVGAVLSSSKAPYNYVAINHPQLNNVRVHPSIAPSLDFLFHMKGSKGLVGAVESMNTAVKRLQVSFSLFHVKALIDAYTGAVPLTNVFKNLYNIATAAGGKTEFHKQYMTGQKGDVVDKLLEGGLKVDPRRGEISDEDVKGGFYEALDSVRQIMDSAIPGSGKIPDLIKKANKLSDRFIWENVHTGLKGMTAMNAYERLHRAWSEEALKNPNAKIPSDIEIASQAASFTNDTFGGLNWRRLADDATTKWGRALALALANPAGRRLSQVMLFAPDWTYSTIRSFFKSVGQGSGVMGLLKPKYLADLHRQYIIRSAFIYLTLYNALNVALSGHPMWENKDPLMVDLGNGEKMQANKHFLETPHMLLNPAKFALGKLGTIPSEVLDQAFHKEYLSPGRMPEMKGGRLEHAAKRLLPFPVQANEYQETPQKLMSALGFPIYGTPTSGRRAEEYKAEKKKKAQEAAEIKKQKRLRELYGE